MNNNALKSIQLFNEQLYKNIIIKRPKNILYINGLEFLKEQYCNLQSNKIYKD